MSSLALSPSGSVPNRGSISRARQTSQLVAILGLALGLRIASAILFPSAHHPDETFQAFEQAHRYAFGYGIKPWEFDVGLRSTVLPALLSVVFRATDALGLPLVLSSRFLLALISLLPVAAVYRAGLRLSPTHAIVGALVAATWCELVNFSFRPLTEALATNFILTALALVSFRSELSRRVLLATGLCLGLATILRIHFAPAALVIVLFLGIMKRPRQMLAFGLGACAPVLVFGLADWIVWGVPFHAPFTAIKVNVIEDVASAFGRSPPHEYVRIIVASYGRVVLLLVGIPLVLRASAYRMWIATALVVLVSHSFIAHKEYRFIFVVTSVLAVAAAFATTDLLFEKTSAWTRPARALCASLLAGAWLAVSAASASTDLQSQARGAFEEEVAAFEVLRKRNDLCGLLLDGVYWYQTGGYVTLRRDVPLYQNLSKSTPARPSIAHNYILAPGPAQPREGYEVVGCFTGRQGASVCLMRREGRCERDPALPSLTQIKRLGDPRLPL